MLYSEYDCYVADVEHASGVPGASPPSRYLPQIQYEGFESTPDEDGINMDDSLVAFTIAFASDTRS